MRRLPLDYPSLFSAWRELAGKLHQPGSPYAVMVSAPGWREKLSLMKNIIGSHPDVLPCMRCGECCLDFPFACRAVEFLYILPFMAAEWPAWRQKAFFEERLGAVIPPCPFLEPDGCSIYPVRPLLCRRAICGEHICNRRSRDFENLGQWCNHDQVVTQLTVMNLVYFDHTGSPPEEMGWPVRVNSGQGPEVKSISVAPFEVWLLIMLKREVLPEDLYRGLGISPLLRFVKPGNQT